MLVSVRDALPRRTAALASATRTRAAAPLTRHFTTRKTPPAAAPAAAPTALSTSSPAPRGVALALAAQTDARIAPRARLRDEFALAGRVALVSGANRGLGLEMALALAEAGARAVYCVDLPAEPGAEWEAVAEYVKRMGAGEGDGEGEGTRMEYVCADVTDQARMWAVGRAIGEREGRMDVCVAAAGILREHTDCLEYPAEQFRKVRAWA